MRAALVLILFSIRSERQLMEQLQYNPLFRWFIGLSVDEPVWVPTVFTKEPRLAADDRDVAQADGRDPGPREGGAAAVGRPFLRRRHARGSLGVVQEFPA